MSEPLQLIICAESLAWQSTLRHRFESAQIHWALGLNQIHGLCNGARFGSVIVEVSSASLLQASACAFQNRNHPNQWLFLAVGNPSALEVSILTKSGFVDCFQDFADLPRLVRNVQKHQDSPQCRRKESIEDRIWRTLPWGSHATSIKA